MRKMLITIILVGLVVAGFSTALYQQTVNINELIDENLALQKDNAQKDLQIQDLTATLERKEVVISRLEELKGVVVSEISYYAPTGNHTATGTEPKAGRTVAVDPNVIPLGSEVYVDGIGWRTAEDTGGAIDGTDVDVFVGSDDEASRGGRVHRAILWREPANE